MVPNVPFITRDVRFFKILSHGRMPEAANSLEKRAGFFQAFRVFHNFVAYFRRFFMKWRQAEKEVPADREEVLIRHNDHFYLANYREVDMMFILRTGGCLPVKGIQWMQIDPPPRK